MPIDSRWPVIGSLPHVVWGQLGYLEDALSRHGSIFRVDFGFMKLVVIADPNLAEEVLIRKTQTFVKGGDFWDTLRETLGLGLPVSEGDIWRRQRRLMNPEFRRQRIAIFRELIGQIVSHHIDRLAKSRGPTDIELWANTLTATLTIRLLLGATMGTDAIERLTPSIETIFDHALRGIIWNQLPAWVPQPGERKYAAAKQAVDSAIYEVISSHKQSGQNDSLLGLLLNAVSAGEMSTEEIRDQAISIYIGGYETTGSAIAWTLWSLAGRPDFCRRLQAEVDNGVRMSEDGRAAPLLEACVHEGLRLYPPGPFIPRYAATDDTIGNFAVNQGEQVFVAPWLIHREPKCWPAAHSFRPERFLDADGNFSLPDVHKLAWCPFGAGQRICIGKELAMMEMRTTLFKFLSRFEIKRDTFRMPKVRLSTTIGSESGIWLTIKERYQPDHLV